MSQQQRRVMTDRTRSSREERQRQREVLRGHFWRSGSRDRLTIITSPSVESVTAGSAEGRRRDGVLELASSRLEVPEPVLNHREQVLESANDSLDSNDGEYEGHDGQSEESKESEKENELSQHGDDTDHQSAWGAQIPIGHEFLSLQRLILTITPGNTESSSRRIIYPGRRTPAPVRVSQNSYTSAIPSRSPTVLNMLATPAITPSHPDPTMLKLDNAGGQQASSRRNMATGLEGSILARAHELMWDWTIFVNPFPDPITLTEEVRTCWSVARTQLGFSDFADATPASNHQVSYP